MTIKNAIASNIFFQILQAERGTHWSYALMTGQWCDLYGRQGTWEAETFQEKLGSRKCRKHHLNPFQNALTYLARRKPSRKGCWTKYHFMHPEYPSEIDTWVLSVPFASIKPVSFSSYNAWGQSIGAQIAGCDISGCETTFTDWFLFNHSYIKEIQSSSSGNCSRLILSCMAESQFHQTFQRLYALVWCNTNCCKVNQYGPVKHQCTLKLWCPELWHQMTCAHLSGGTFSVA